MRLGGRFWLQHSYYYRRWNNRWESYIVHTKMVLLLVLSHSAFRDSPAGEEGMTVYFAEDTTFAFTHIDDIPMAEFRFVIVRRRLMTC